MRSPQPTIQIEEVRTVGVPVTDQDRAIRFYVDTLGFETRLDVPIGHGKRRTVVTHRREQQASHSWPRTSVTRPGSRPASGSSAATPRPPTPR